MRIHSSRGVQYRALAGAALQLSKRAISEFESRPLDEPIATILVLGVRSLMLAPAVISAINNPPHGFDLSPQGHSGGIILSFDPLSASPHDR